MALSPALVAALSPVAVTPHVPCGDPAWLAAATSAAARTRSSVIRAVGPQITISHGNPGPITPCG